MAPAVPYPEKSPGSQRSIALDGRDATLSLGLAVQIGTLILGSGTLLDFALRRLRLTLVVPACIHRIRDGDASVGARAWAARCHLHWELDWSAHLLLYGSHTGRGEERCSLRDEITPHAWR